MPTYPYIHFRGNCAEAMTAYAEIFGSAPPQLMRYGEAPGAEEAWKGSDRVMHGSVALFDGMLMASDYPPGAAGDAQAAVSVMQSAPDVATGARIFEALRDGGAVIHPWGSSFFAAGFGMLTDRFGTHWILTVEGR